MVLLILFGITITIILISTCGGMPIFLNGIITHNIYAILLGSILVFPIMFIIIYNIFYKKSPFYIFIGATFLFIASMYIIPNTFELLKNIITIIFIIFMIIFIIKFIMFFCKSKDIQNDMKKFFGIKEFCASKNYIKKQKNNK